MFKLWNTENYSIQKIFNPPPPLHSTNSLLYSTCITCISLAFSYAARPFNNHNKIFSADEVFTDVLQSTLTIFFFFCYLRQVAGINRLGINPANDRSPTPSLHTYTVNSQEVYCTSFYLVWANCVLISWRHIQGYIHMEDNHLFFISRAKIGYYVVVLFERGIRRG